MERLPKAKRERYFALKAIMQAGGRIPLDDFKFVKGIDIARGVRQRVQQRTCYKDPTITSNHYNA